MVFYYQPVAVYTPTYNDELSEEVLSDVQSRIKDEMYQKRELPVTHEQFFHLNQGVTYSMFVDGLQTYTFYAFRMTYQTNHSEGPPTNFSIIRTKEDGMQFLFYISGLEG